jgi:hypothetical protein
MDPVRDEELHRELVRAQARGHQQRAAAFTREAEPPGGGDPGLANNHLLEWGYGKRSADKVQREADLAVKAGARGGCLEKLAKLGNGHSSNVARDMGELARNVLALGVIPIYVAMIPLFVFKSEHDAKPQPGLCPCGFLLPHIWIWYLYTHYRHIFLKRFIGITTESQAAQRLSAFWNSVHPGDPRRCSLFNKANFATRCVPLGLHGDGVPCTKRDTLDVCSVFGILGLGSTIDLVYYIWAFFKKCEVDELTAIEFTDWLSGLTHEVGYEVVIWSLLALETGLHPTHDHRGEAFTTEPWVSLAGTLIAGGFFAMLWQFRADAEYHYNHIQLPGHWSSGSPCHMCRCSSVKGSLEYHLYFGRDSTWPGTVFLDMGDFFAFCVERGKRIHPLLKPRVDGENNLGGNIFLFLRDSLHVLDLGTSQYLLGSCLWLLCFGTYLFVNDSLRAMRDIMHEINVQYSREETKTRFSNIVIDMFANADNPRQYPAKLNGKAAECRGLVPIMYFIWQKHTSHTIFDDHITECLRIMCDIYGILDFKTDANQTPQFLSEAACDELRALIDLYLTHYTYLSTVCLANDPPLDLFHAVSKNHAMWHIGFEAQFGHPSSARTYLNEDFMQHVKEAGEACRFNVAAAKRSQVVAERFAMGKCLELQIKHA